MEWSLILIAAAYFLWPLFWLLYVAGAILIGAFVWAITWVWTSNRIPAATIGNPHTRIKKKEL